MSYTSLQEANRYLEEVFVPDFNRRFTVKPAESASAFTRLAGVDLALLLSAQHERVVRKDNTVVFQKMLLQLDPSRNRMHFVRCPVLVHEFFDGTLGVSYQGRLIGRYNHLGEIIRARKVA